MVCRKAVVLNARAYSFYRDCTLMSQLGSNGQLEMQGMATKAYRSRNKNVDQQCRS